MNTATKMMIVGKIPPPYGGVTVHLFRLIKQLESNNFPFRFCDLSERASSNPRFIKCGNVFSLISVLLFTRYEAIHCHASNPLLFILIDLLVARLLHKKTIYTLHGEGNLLLCENGSFAIKYLLRGAFKRAARIITINSNCKERALLFAASPERVVQMTAYLPPAMEEIFPKAHSKQVESFFAVHQRCFVSQGNFGNSYVGNDLYRFDLLGHALSSVRSAYPDVGLCTLVSQTLKESARNEVFELRKNLGLEDHWLILENFGSAIPIYTRCIAFIRPTMSDGDSLSIRECLDLGIPVIASNAVPRPKGCIIFESGDLASLNDSLFALLINYTYYKEQADLLKQNNCMDVLLSCYQNVLLEKKN